MKMRRSSCGVCVCLLMLTALTSCTSPVHGPEVYYWGSYEKILYNIYRHPDKADPSTQIETLLNLIDSAERKGKRVPPGVYAHLGMVYAAVGDTDGALEAFAQEKRLFPEATTMVDGIISRSRDTAL